MSSAVIGALRVTMGLDSAAFTEGLDKAQKHLRDVGSRMERIGGKMKSIGAGMSVALTAPIVAFGVTTMRAAGDFEQAMNRVQAVSGATSEEFAKLRQQARDLGAATQFSASEAADAMGFLSMAGMKATDILAAMPKTLELAASAQLDMGRAADIVTNIMAGYGLGVEELGRANDVLVKSFTSANTDLSQLAEAMKYAGPVASAAGTQFEEAAAALSLMGNAGIQGSMAGTSLRGAISRILSPTKAMSSAMQAAGLQFTDAKGKLLPLVDIIRALEPHATDAGLFMTLFGQRAGPAMAALVSQGADALKNLNTELLNSSGTASKIAEVQMRGFNGAMRELKSAFEELQLAVADSGILQMLQGFAVKLAEIIRGVAAANPQLLAIAVVVAAVVAAIGPLIFIAGALVASIGALLPLLGLIAPFILPVIGVVAALTVGFLAFKDTIITVAKAFTTTLKESMGPKIMPLFDALKGAFSAVGEVFNTIFGGQSGTTEGLEMFARIVARVFSAAVDLITGAINVIANILRAFAALLRGDFSTMWNALGSAVKSVVVAIARAFETLFPGVTEWVQRTVSAVRDWLVTRFQSWIVEPVRKKIEAVKGFFFGLYDAVVGHSYIPDMVEGVAAWMAKLDAGMVQPARNATAETKRAFEKLRDDVASIMEGLLTDAERNAREVENKVAKIRAAVGAGILSKDQAAQVEGGIWGQGLTMPEGIKLAPSKPLIDPEALESLRSLQTTTSQISAPVQQALGGILDATQSLSDGLVDLALTGRGSLSELLMSFVATVAKIIVEMLALKAIEMATGIPVSTMMGGSRGGGVGGFFGNLLGFKDGGSFTVGGSGSVDSKLVAFRATPGERVDISTPGQQRQQGGGQFILHVAPSEYFDARVERVATPIAAQSAAMAAGFAQKNTMETLRRRDESNRYRRVG
ncbi:phage tail tape measure protein [Brevundimonas sp.]|uniref:phage tail tape measure protein n=1 Tax=Brevundimonas sp. TaxID=1871086 RepID=UPI0025C579D8|nr:phage tail tape measure protein [Brevundimonas sp.]